MEQRSRTLALSLAILIAAGAIAPARAYAWPLGKLFHLHPAADKAQKALVNVQFYNAGRMFQDVLVDGRIYTVKPHYYMTIQAQPGTAVFAASSTLGYRRGDVMFTISPEMNNKTIAFK
jgi:hypothetical protein